MSIKTILAGISSDDHSATVLECANRIAQSFGSHIEALHVRADPRGLVPYTGEGMDGTMIEEIMDVTERESGERARRVRAAFDAFCESEKKISVAEKVSIAGPTINWREEIGREDEVVSVRGRLFDLIAVGRPVKDQALPSPITLEAALLDTGRPVLLVPPQLPAETGKNIAVAWESSPEASRAIANSLPILSKADKVTLLVRNPMEPPEIAPEEAVARFSWSGIKAEILEFKGDAEEVGAAYLNRSKDVGADLLIKGAYARARVRQMILGGRTRHIIGNAEIPVFLSR
jgi:nucleotide-binding universal stress UspA family protein